LNSDQYVEESVRRAQFANSEEAQPVEVDNREVAADNSLMSCIVARMEEHFVDNILAGSKANNRFPDEAEGAAVDRNSRMDLEDMSDNAFDAWVAKNQVEVDAARKHDTAALNHHLFDRNEKSK
jgi:hypothetical protein